MEKSGLINNEPITLNSLLDALATAHQKGFSSGQEHSEPSKGTIKLIDEVKEQFDEKIMALEKDKVSHTVFWSLVGIMMTVVSGMFYLVYDKVNDVDNKMVTTNESVNIIKGRLEPITLNK